MILSYKYRVNPTRAQSTALEEMLGAFCDLYNAALQQRLEACRRRGRLLTFYDQRKEVKHLGAADERFFRFSSSAQELVLRRVDKTFRAFASRVRKKKKIGLPRFKSIKRYHAAEFRFGNGLTIKDDRLRILGVTGTIKVRWHRPLPSPPKHAVISRQNNKWYVIFQVEVAASERRSGESIALDLGLSSLVAASTGEIIERPNFTKRYSKKLRRRHRALSRCKKGSNRRRRAILRASLTEAKAARARSDFLHKPSTRLTSRYAQIAVEELNVIGLARFRNSKHVYDAAWSKFLLYLTYKAERAGGEIIQVDARGTSQTCPRCGQLSPKSLKCRLHECDCGCVMDRDVAAAHVIYYRAFGSWPGTGHRTLSRQNTA